MPKILKFLIALGAVALVCIVGLVAYGVFRLFMKPGAQRVTPITTTTVPRPLPPRACESRQRRSPTPRKPGVPFAPRNFMAT